MCKRGLWKLAVLSIRATLGNLDWGSFTGDFERERVKERSVNGATF